jgi:hypothetical protein
VRPQSVLKIEQPSQNPEPTRGLEPRTPSITSRTLEVAFGLAELKLSGLAAACKSCFCLFGDQFRDRVPRTQPASWSRCRGLSGRAARRIRKACGGPGPSSTTARLVVFIAAARHERRGAAQLMNAMSSAGMVTNGRIMSRSSCSSMWQWYMYRPA